MNQMNRRRASDSRPDAMWLVAALREQAHEHEADLGRIGARFERLIAGEPRPGEPRRTEPRRARPRQAVGPARLRLIGVPLGILAVMAAVAVAVGVSLGLGDGRAAAPPSHVAAPPSSRVSAAATPGPSSLSASSAPLPAGTASARGDATATRSARALTAVGTVDASSSQYWVQEDLTITTTRTTRELHVIVTVSGGSTVRSTGMWTTILPADAETAVRVVPAGLVYEITLKPGHILQPAAYRFGFQFNRPASGHHFALDAYTISAVTTDAGTESASGRF